MALFRGTGKLTVSEFSTLIDNSEPSRYSFGTWQDSAERTVTFSLSYWFRYTPTRNERARHFIPFLPIPGCVAGGWHVRSRRNGNQKQACPLQLSTPKVRLDSRSNTCIRQRGSLVGQYPQKAARRNLLPFQGFMSGKRVHGLPFCYLDRPGALYEQGVRPWGVVTRS